MNSPTVSVVMAVHNGENFIRETLDSILYQTYSDWECIVINDFSTDSSLDILNEYAAKDSRFVVRSNEVNLRLAKSLNVALDIAKGKYVIRFDADDLQLPNRFERQVAFMDANPDIDVSFPQHFTLRDGILSTSCCGRYSEPSGIAAMLLCFNPVLHPGVIARREVMLEYKYDGNNTCSEDMDLWARMIVDGKKIACQQEFLSIYRLHGGQITANTKEKAKGEVSKILNVYYNKMLGIDDEQFVDNFVNDCYYHDADNLDNLARFYKTLIKYNKVAKTFDERYILRATIDLISEMKRVHGLPKSQVIKLLKFGGLKFVSEYISRKKRISNDFARSIIAAESAGYKMIKNTESKVPTFEK